ncbi:hypothetical protein P1P68_30175 [Streptomyces scabiei]|uniref:hypothetical protein n=1 Tax=Streptomyces scabiei TaxID=1930 RepID=UPI00298F63D8|nr:hypothetical protein [Streptomyces scabiei]MDW8808950.1 hypothetical protein [Streptomyces scabiei]
MLGVPVPVPVGPLTGVRAGDVEVRPPTAVAGVAADGPAAGGAQRGAVRVVVPRTESGATAGVPAVHGVPVAVPALLGVTAEAASGGPVVVAGA